MIYFLKIKFAETLRRKNARFVFTSTLNEYNIRDLGSNDIQLWKSLIILKVHTIIIIIKNVYTLFDLGSILHNIEPRKIC